MTIETNRGQSITVHDKIDWSTGRITGPELIKFYPDIDDDGFLTKKYEMYHKALAENDMETISRIMDDTLYAYIALKWNGEPIRLKYYQDAIMTDEHRRIDVEAANQQGKVADNNEKVLTTKGWKRNGQLKVGDYVYGRDGRPTMVTAVFPHKDWKFYKVTFNDGTFVHVGLEHLWICKTGRERFRKSYSKNGKKWANPTYQQWQVMDTEDIIKAGGYDPKAKNNWSKVSIPVCDPVDFPARKQLYDPYSLGLMLGDGCIKRCTQFTSKDEELFKYLTWLYGGQYHKCGNHYSGNIYDTKWRMKDLGLYGCDSSTKFIPTTYFRDSVERRKALLAGLMDTDGSVYDKGTQCEYCTVSPRLRDDIVELITGLGGIVYNVVKKKPWYNDPDGNRVYGKTAWSIRFKTTFNPFKLKRKADKWKQVTKYKHERVIESIEFSHVADGTCIMVDNKDHSYLITKNHIVTHNSFSLCVKSSVKFLQDHGKNTYIGLISKSMAQNSMNMRMVRKMIKSSDFKYTPGGNDNMTVMVHDFYKRDENGRVIKNSYGKPIVLYSNTLVCSVASTGALGFPFDWLMLDEFEFWENPEGLEYMYDQVLEPRTFHTKGQIIIYSNPNGKNYVSENLHKRKVKVYSRYRGSGMGVPQKNRPNQFTEEYQFHVYNINFLDNPSNTLEEWETKKQHVHPIIFASTMAAERTEAEGSALTAKDIESTQDDELTEKGFHLASGKMSWWFLDLGFVSDQSVLVCGWKEFPQKNVIRKNADGKEETLAIEENEPIFKFAVHAYTVAKPLPEIWSKGEMDSVPQILERFGRNREMFGMDITGKEGNELLASNAGIDALGIKMIGQWKATHYERFITLCKQGRIKVSWEENYLDGHNKNFPFQARSLKISTKMSDGRSLPYPIYHHEKESDKDDILDAVVGCLSLMDDEMPDGSSFESDFVEYKYGNEEFDPPTFDEFLEQNDVPSFMSKDELRIWYNRRYGLEGL